VRKTTTYGRLTKLLESLGLVPLPLPNKGECFTTPAGRVLLLFAAYQPNDLVRRTRALRAVFRTAGNRLRRRPSPEETAGRKESGIFSHL
jgi:hypothetical protein